MFASEHSTDRWGIVESGRGPDGQTTFGSKTRASALLRQNGVRYGNPNEAHPDHSRGGPGPVGHVGIAKDVPVGFEEIRMRF
jgi:hypothetical protein